MRAILLITTLSLSLVACGSNDEEHEPSAIEAAGKERGQAIAQDLKEEINRAKDLEKQAQQAAEDLDKQVDPQPSSEEPAAEEQP